MGQLASNTEGLVQATLEEKARAANAAPVDSSYDYVTLRVVTLWSIHLIVIVRREMLGWISDVRSPTHRILLPTVP